MKSRAILWGVVDWIFLLSVLTVNYLANAMPLGGRTTGEISDGFHALFVPAGYAFSIWGLIYLALIGFAVFSVLPTQRENPRVRATDGWFALSSAANCGWLFSWHYGLYALNMALMLVLLGSLIPLYASQRGPGADKAPLSAATRVLALAPFSLYLGWISVAAIANASAVLSWAGWGGWGISPVAWTVIVSCLAGVLSALMSLRYGELIFPAVIVWALIAVIVRGSAQPEIVRGCVAGIAVAVTGAVAGQFVRRRAR